MSTRNHDHDDRLHHGVSLIINHTILLPYARTMRVFCAGEHSGSM